MTGLTTEQQLDIISRAWGLQDGSGYVFFPWIPGNAETKEQRIRGFHEGPAFQWPNHKPDIIAYLEDHKDDDVYWCPSMFEKHTRRMENAMDECALWADLDEVNPTDIDEQYQPTVAWETSPGRYQALWIARRPMLGASWQGGENQKLTYFLGADSNGWDTTQLLRIPGWRNHKYSYWKGRKKYVIGKLLWNNRRTYARREFEDLPEVRSRASELQQILEPEVEAVDVHEVKARIRLRLPKNTRELLLSREVNNDRSETLWAIEKELAKAGCTAPEIIALVRGTVWNKYDGRADEFLRLSTEAAKAVDEVTLEEWEEPKPKSTIRIATVLANVPKPKWLIRNIWTEGSCGFIGGQPKTWKSWVSLDMALSIATGSLFLNQFPIVNPGPVLYVQEEDSLARLKDRFDKMWSSKTSWRVAIGDDGEPVAIPAEEMTKDPDIGLHVKTGLVLSDEGWQEWLVDKVAEGLDNVPYKAVILDPLMYMLGGVDENRAADMMTKVLKPLKAIADKHEVAIIVVHHMKKANGPRNQGERGGQLLLGSVANHAWTEDSMFLHQVKQDVLVDVESKTAVGGSFKVAGLKARGWNPTIYDVKFGMQDELVTKVRNNNRPGKRPNKVMELWHTLPPGSYKGYQLSKQAGVTPAQVSRSLTRNGIPQNDDREWVKREDN